MPTAQHSTAEDAGRRLGRLGIVWARGCHGCSHVIAAAGHDLRLEVAPRPFGPEPRAAAQLAPALDHVDIARPVRARAYIEGAS